MLGSSRSQIQITNGFGLHLRAANRVVQLAQQYQSEIWILSNGRAADCKSILDLMTLAAGVGTSVEIEAHGDDAEEATAALHDLIEAGFHECQEAEPADGEH